MMMIEILVMILEQNVKYWGLGLLKGGGGRSEEAYWILGVYSSC